MRVGVITFPGSNCDGDMFRVLSEVLGQDCVRLWHKEADLKDCDCVVLPGGFSYGDYLRPGIIARFSPVMEKVMDFARRGGYVLGICNGFQILCEAGLLPGTLCMNEARKFVCKNVYLRVENTEAGLTAHCRAGQVLKVPVAHAAGRYFADGKTLEKLKKKGQILFRYCDERGEVSAEANPNGSVENIAGICNEEGNVWGMMPHPERCAEEVLGNTDGRILLEGLMKTMEKRYAGTAL